MSDPQPQNISQKDLGVQKPDQSPSSPDQVTQLGIRLRNTRDTVQNLQWVTLMARPGMIGQGFVRHEVAESIINKELATGKSLEQIGHDASIASLRTGQQALDIEQNFQTARIDNFRREGIPPASDQQLLQTLWAIEQHKGVDTTTHAYRYVSERMMAGVDVPALRQEVQNRLKHRRDRNELLEVALKIKSGASNVAGKEKVDAWVARGWDLDRIIQSTQQAIERDNDFDIKREEYSNVLNRVGDIPKEKTKIAESLQKAQEGTFQPPILERKPRPISTGDTPEVPFSKYDLTGLQKHEHTGGAVIYFIDTPNGSSVLKIVRNNPDQAYKELVPQIQALQKAKGAAGLPVLEAVIKEYNNVVGMQQERVVGQSLNSMMTTLNMTPDRFGGSQRAQLIQDLIDAYRLTGSTHGDLFQYRLRPDGTPRITNGNLDNLMLEDGTNRIRMIDYNLHGDWLPDGKVSNIDIPRFELQGVIEFLFMGRQEENPKFHLPTDPQLQHHGQEMLGKLKDAKSLDDFSRIIPAALVAKSSG